MTIFQFSTESIKEVPRVTFASLRIRERDDVQRLLRSSIDVVSKDIMVLAEEYGEWEDSRRRIDLLGLDRGGHLVVFELKRTEDGGHMELQALRYAAMVSTMKFEQAVEAHRTFLLAQNLPEHEAEKRIRVFLEAEEGPIAFSNRVRIVLVGADFNKEVTSSVLWLNDQGLDITCVRLRPHRLNDITLLDVEQVIPLPEAAEFQIAIREKSNEIEAAKAIGRDFTRYRLRTPDGEAGPLSKRRFMFEVVKASIRLGLHPDRIIEAVPWRRTTMFVSLPGQLAGQEVVSAAGGKSENRYFCADGEAFHVAGKTFVLSNQWGSRTEEAASNLLSVLPPDHGITYEALPAR